MVQVWDNSYSLVRGERAIFGGIRSRDVRDLRRRGTHWRSARSQPITETALRRATQHENMLE